MCGSCEDRRKGRTDSELRVLVLKGNPPPMPPRGLLPWEVAKWHGPADLVNRSGFRWFGETLGAVPSRRDHFSYVDIGGLVAALAVRPAGAPLVRGSKCPQCGKDDQYIEEPPEIVSEDQVMVNVPAAADPILTDLLGGRFATPVSGVRSVRHGGCLRCAACGHRQPWPKDRLPAAW